MRAAREVWRQLPYHLGDTPLHMGLTDALVRHVSALPPAIWWHATNQASILTGPRPKQLSSGLFETALPVYRRPTGGGAVLVGPGVLGVDIALPRTHPLLTGDVVHDYAWVGQVWHRTLDTLGIESQVLDIATAKQLTDSSGMLARSIACFGGFSPYELVVGTRKVVGLSQLRRGNGVLFASAVYLSTAPSALATAIAGRAQMRFRLAHELNRCSSSLDLLAGRPLETGEVMTAFARAIGDSHNVHLRASTWKVQELLHAEAAAASAERRDLR